MYLCIFQIYRLQTKVQLTSVHPEVEAATPIALCPRISFLSQLKVIYVLS